VVSLPRVVVADDHAGVLQAATSILAQAFDVVSSVLDGEAAVDATLRSRPDAVVLDIDMPRLDGFRTAARIRSSGSDARIVFLSSHDDDDFVIAGMTRGASAFVAKPRMDRDLVLAVGQVLAGRSFVPTAAVLPRWQPRTAVPHDLQLYATDETLVDAVVSVFESALAVGDSIMAIASEPHRKGLDAAFRARGVDTVALVRCGRFTIGDAASALDALLLNGVPDAGLFAAVLDPLLARALAAARGSTLHVTMYGEIAPILCAAGDFEAMVRLERIASEYAASRPLSILCGYSTACMADEMGALEAAICAEHSAIVPAADRH
jgi:DNA-binding NarL/FixJ family response regulator